MDVRHKSVENAKNYQATHYRILHKVFKSLNIVRDTYTFIDFGCGKGRGLMMASRRDFKKIIGIDFSRKLCGLAENNLRQYFKKYPGFQKDLEIFNMDATEYHVPDSPGVYYFYNPFDGAILKRVLQNIKAKRKNHPKDLFIYVNPRQGAIFELMGFQRTYEIKDRNFNKIVRIYSCMN